MMNFEKHFEESDVYYKSRIETTLTSLRNNFFCPHYADNKQEALEIAKNLALSFLNSQRLGKNLGTIGIGDSMTLHQIGLIDWVYSPEISSRSRIYNPFERLEDGRFSEFKGYPNDWLPAETYLDIMDRVWEKGRQAILSDVFFTGANAVTLKGDIVSTDGVGNRISAVIWGPKKVILVLGRNKIVGNVEEALLRVKNVAAPLNHLRHSVKHRIQGEKAEANYGTYKLGKLPCVQKGYCVDCGAPLCTRNCTMIMNRATGRCFRDKERIHVIIVNEDLGL